ncbi:HTH_38 domain-containing protein [Trichonephila clavipes]|nr:HTH_38 domain-containing protein [Trichonephila clavipes]
MSRRKQRSAFDQESEFDRGRIVAYRDCGLSFREIAYARTIRRRLHQSGLSARHPLLGLPLTQNHKRLCRQWCDEEGYEWQNGMKLSLLTSPASVCNTTMVGFGSGGTVERGC